MNGHSFILRGNRGNAVHCLHSRTRFEIKGDFQVEEVTAIAESSAPAWVAEILYAHPEIDQIAISGELYNVVWTRVVIGVENAS